MSVAGSIQNSALNQVRAEDRAVHEWYRFVLSFPPHLVREYLDRFGVDARQTVLDPFCGTGTTLVECKKLGIPSVGIEASPMACFASQVKVDWSPTPSALIAHAGSVADATLERLRQDNIEDTPLLYAGHDGRTGLRSLPPERMALLLAESISPVPLHKVLSLLECLEQHRDLRYYNHERLALARALVASISNLTFGPEVGVGGRKPDTPVVSPWMAAVRAIADDLSQELIVRHRATPCSVCLGDARQPHAYLAPNCVDAVITSPPYPNEKDYTRTTRLESVLLGLIGSRDDLRAIKQGLIRSNTRSVYRGDRDDEWVRDNQEVQRIAEEIEARRVALGKTSGFERQYARLTRLYFGGMARHLSGLRGVLRPGAQLAYVVGDQASYLRVMIRTGRILASIAQSLGYEVLSIRLFRTRLATATREQLREEVVVLRWPGTRTLGTGVAYGKSPEG